MRGFWLVVLTVLAVAGPGAASAMESRGQSLVGERVVPFKVASSNGAVADFVRDYYGRHHLVLTFFPAAFTPV